MYGAAVGILAVSVSTGPGFPAPFGLIELVVGPPDERLEVAFVLTGERVRDPEADGDAEVRVQQVPGVRRDDGADLVAERRGVLCRRLRQQQHELLAAVAGGSVDLAAGLPEKPRDHLEHLVAGRVRKGVVDPFEVRSGVYSETLPLNLEGVDLHLDLDAEGYVLQLEVLSATRLLELIGRQGGRFVIPERTRDPETFSVTARFPATLFPAAQGRA